MTSHWDFSEYHTGTHHLPWQQDAGWTIFILGIVQLYQVSSCLKIQQQKVKAGWEGKFKIKISNNHGFSARGQQGYKCLTPSIIQKSTTPASATADPFGKAPSLSERLWVTQNTLLPQAGGTACLVWRKKTRLPCMQEEKCRNTKWNFTLYQTHLEHSFRFSEVHCFLNISPCFHCLVLISLGKPRNNSISQQYILLFCTSDTFLKYFFIWVTMCEKKLWKKKNMTTEKWKFHEPSSPGCPQFPRTSVRPRGRSRCFLQPGENLRECWRTLSFQSDTVKQFLNWLQSKWYCHMLKGRHCLQFT